MYTERIQRTSCRFPFYAAWYGSSTYDRQHVPTTDKWSCISPTIQPTSSFILASVSSCTCSRTFQYQCAADQLSADSCCNPVATTCACAAPGLAGDLHALLCDHFGRLRPHLSRHLLLPRIQTCDTLLETMGAATVPPFPVPLYSCCRC